MVNSAGASYRWAVWAVVATAALCGLASCQSPPSPSPRSSPSGAVASAQRTAPVVSVADYLRQLPPPPITVGVDVDDTALFSTPAFILAKGRLVPEPPADGDAPDKAVEAWRAWAATLDARREELFRTVVGSTGQGLTPYQQRQWAQFWDDVNTAGGAYSPPKAVTRDLVRAHLRRGDRVEFITARPKATTETLTAKLRADFGSDAIAVRFTTLGPKDAVIRGEHMAIYYGDADADMDDAAAGGARGVRVVRSKYSSNPQPTHPGERGEWFVLADSDL